MCRSRRLALFWTVRTVFLACLVTETITANVTPFLVKPSATTSGIDPGFDRRHFVYRPTDKIEETGRLLLFLPGTGGAPSAYRAFLETASSLGLHTIGLSYVNGESMASYCSNAETGGCFEEARLEVIDGVDRVSALQVDRQNSIENRLVRLLLHLAVVRENEEWETFLKATRTKVNWSKVIVAGHSQGGGHAGVIAKHHEVSRVAMIASTDWWLGERRPADWMSEPSATPKIRYFGLGHERDLLVLKNRYLEGWKALGLEEMGEIQAPESPSGIYFGGTHRLITDVTPRVRTPLLDAHSAMIVDAFTPLDIESNTPVMETAWRYLLVGPTETPTPELALEVSNELATLSAHSLPGFDYHLQNSRDLLNWENTRDSGVRSTNTNLATWKRPIQRSPLKFWRVVVRFK